MNLAGAQVYGMVWMDGRFLDHYAFSFKWREQSSCNRQTQTKRGLHN